MRPSTSSGETKSECRDYLKRVEGGKGKKKVRRSEGKKEGELKAQS